MHTFIEIALIIIAVYCFVMWIAYAGMAIVSQRRGLLTDLKAREIAEFTFRVGLTGTIALAALYIGG